MPAWYCVLENVPWTICGETFYSLPSQGGKQRPAVIPLMFCQLSLIPAVSAVVDLHIKISRFII